MAETEGLTQTEAKKPATGSVTDDLDSIDKLIPYNRQFLKYNPADSDETVKSSGLMGKVGSNVKGFFGGFRPKELERPEVIRLRAQVGDLKNTKVAPIPVPEASVAVSSGSKTKRELLEEKRKTISDKAKEGKNKEHIGLRIEMEKLKKKYPGDFNLVLLDAILISRDGCLPYRSLDERISSLSAALRETSQLVARHFLTTYSVDVLFDIYFLYLETLKKYLMDKMRKLTTSGKTKKSVAVRSVQRDIKVVNLLLNQDKLRKTISNVCQKLNGFGYPYVNLSSLDVSKTFEASDSEENDKIGPGTVKLNRFLVRIYVSVLAQIPMFQPIASRLCDALPNDYASKIIVANANMDNAYTQLRISRILSAPTIAKQTLALYLFGKHTINSTLKGQANSPAEARIFLRTAEMAEEYAFNHRSADPEMVKFGHSCATTALSFFQSEAESIIRRLYEIAEVKKIDLQGSSE